MNVLGLCVIVIVMGLSVEAQLNSTCNSNDSMVLKRFMNGMDTAIDGWTSNSPNCCDWDGVTCDFSGNVIRLELSRKKLVGTLADSLTSLNQLRTLNLSGNLLKGILPSSLFHLPHLEILNLSANEFSGSFPSSVNLPSIQLLDVSDNNLEGPIAPGLCVNSTGVRELKMGVNYFNGEIPPEFENCSSLEHLCLDANFVSGIIPEYLFKLPRLVRLSLQDNNLIGQLHNTNPSNLVYFDVSLNQISGTLPDFFHTFPNLNYFAAHSNGLFGTIPPSLSNSGSISSFILRNNWLVGPIGLYCSTMINLTFLDLADNKFLGAIPDNLPLCPNLKMIDLGGNHLTGQIPETFKKFESLSYLSLSMCNLNNLSGSLEVLQHCPNLTTLVLSGSFDNEEIPSDSNLQFKMLKTLAIPNCKLTGKIPNWLNGLTNLRILDLSLNQLNGPIPPFLGSLSSLVYLDLSNNFLDGQIPKSLTRLPGLRAHNISFKLTFDFPVFMKRGMNGKVLYYSYRGSAVQYNKIISLPPLIALSNNLLSGEIPPEFGNLKKLHVLELDHNNLSGTIPISLSGLRCLLVLDLSFNSLTGTIPASLVGLSFLSKFSVAYNNLTGTIPSGGQFSTFANSSFEGNSCLCGEFFITCNETQVLLQTPASENKQDFAIILPVFTGFGTGFLVTIFVLLVVPAIRVKK